LKALKNQDCIQIPDCQLIIYKLYIAAARELNSFEQNCRFTKNKSLALDGLNPKQ